MRLPLQGLDKLDERWLRFLLVEPLDGPVENHQNMSLGPVDDDSADRTVRNYYPCDSGLCTPSSTPRIGGWSAVTAVVPSIHTSYDYEELILDKKS